VLDGPREQPKPYENRDFVLTRLHARYGKDLEDDLRFSLAPPIVGGREQVAAAGKLEEGARAGAINNFQGRYAIRYPWTGPIRCNNPQRGRWGGPWPGVTPSEGDAKPALNLAAAPRGNVQLASLVAADVPEIGVKTGGVTVEPPPAPGSAVPPPAGSGDGATKKKTGCGCQTSGHDDVLALVGIALVGLRRRRRKL